METELGSKDRGGTPLPVAGAVCLSGRERGIEVGMGVGVGVGLVSWAVEAGLCLITACNPSFLPPSNLN